MDVQNSFNAFTRLNDLARPAGSTAGLHWADALEISTSPPAGIAGLTPNQPDSSTFHELLNKAIDVKADPSQKPQQESEKDQEIRKWAQTLVNKFFVGAMLKQMRDSPFKSEMFTGGKGGQAYQGMMDQHIAEHAGSKIAKSLVDSIVKSHHRAPSNPETLYADPAQQRQINEYLKSHPKRESHASATPYSA